MAHIENPHGKAFFIKKYHNVIKSLRNRFYATVDNAICCEPGWLRLCKIE